MTVTAIVWLLIVLRLTLALLAYAVNRRFVKYLRDELSGRIAAGQNGDQSLVLKTDIMLLKFVELALLTMWLTAAVRVAFIPLWYFGAFDMHEPHFDPGDVVGSIIVLYFTHRGFRVVVAKLRERRALAESAQEER